MKDMPMDNEPTIGSVVNENMDLRQRIADLEAQLARAEARCKARAEARERAMRVIELLEYHYNIPQIKTRAFFEEAIMEQDIAKAKETK